MHNMAKFCLTYQNAHKRQVMQHKFDLLAWQVHFQEGFPAEHGERAPHPDQLHRVKQRQRWDAHAWSVMQGHMAMLEHFVQHTTEPYGMFMEDDIHIRGDINDHLPKILQDMKVLNLDLLLLGYLTHAHLHTIHAQMPVLNQPFTFHEYPFNVYGLQMYVMSRAHATDLVTTYGKQSVWTSEVLDTDATYNPDWILSKQGRRACVYPLLAVEARGGGMVYADEGQLNWHRMCHEAHYDAHKFI